MKTRLLPLLVLTTFFSCHFEDDSQARKEELKNIVLDYYNALAKKDLQKANTITTSNFILFDEGVIYNNESAIKAVEQMKPFTVTFAIDSLNVHVDKKNASAYYFRSADFVFGDSTHMPVRFLESATFNKEGDTWKLRSLNSQVRKQ